MKIPVALVFGLALTTSDDVRFGEKMGRDASWPQWGRAARDDCGSARSAMASRHVPLQVMARNQLGTR